MHQQQQQRVGWLAGDGNGDEEGNSPDGQGQAKQGASCEWVKLGTGLALLCTHKTLIMDCNVK